MISDRTIISIVGVILVILFTATLSGCSAPWGGSRW